MGYTLFYRELRVARNLLPLSVVEIFCFPSIIISPKLLNALRMLLSSSARSLKTGGST
jgi:hypothetical protein